MYCKPGKVHPMVEKSWPCPSSTPKRLWKAITSSSTTAAARSIRSKA